MLKHFHIQRLTLAVMAALGLAGAAQACNPNYISKAGDTLFSVAEANLGELTKWSLLLHSNPSLAGASMIDLPAGTVLRIPCPEGSIVIEDTQLTSATIIDETQVDVRFLTGGNYAPFTGRDLPQQGMVTEIVDAALEASQSGVTHSISWEDDWSKHLFPMLENAEFDMGYPWMRPDCEGVPGTPECTQFHYSDPLMTVPMMLFVRSDNQFRFNSDADVVGRTLCRPAGYFVGDLDRGDRRWVTEEKITLIQGTSATDCLRKLVAGDVDAVTVNLFEGATEILRLGLRNTVVPLEKALSEEGLHVVVAKTHWRGTAHLYRVNAGLATLKKDGRYEEIVARHLIAFQSKLQ